MGIRCAYYVPYLHGHGGVQQYAKMQLPYFADRCELTLVDWQYPLSRPTEAAVRLAPPTIARAIWAREFHGRFGATPPEVDIEHYWQIGAAAARATHDVPYVITCHGSDVLAGALRPAYRDRFRQVMAGAAAVTANSSFTKQLVEANFGLPPEKVRLMLPGIDTAGYAPRPRSASPEKWRVGTLCRLEPRKNVIAVIEALQRLQGHTNTKIEYALAGDGPERPRIIRALKRSGLQWHYYGRIDEQVKIQEFYPGLDAFVLVPLALKRDVEGFGLVYLEANASGVPVVAARTGGIESAVRDGVSGRFADPNSPSDVGRAIEAVIGAGEGLRRSALGWAQTFSAAAAAEAFFQLYREVLAMYGARQA